jgi:hypothetical protein
MRRRRVRCQCDGQPKRPLGFSSRDAYTAMMLRMSTARITGHGGGEGGPSGRVSAADEGVLAAAVRRRRWKREAGRGRAAWMQAAAVERRRGPSAAAVVAAATDVAAMLRCCHCRQPSWPGQHSRPHTFLEPQPHSRLRPPPCGKKHARAVLVVAVAAPANAPCSKHVLNAQVSIRSPCCRCPAAGPRIRCSQ